MNMTTNGTENEVRQWKTPDGYIFNDFTHAVVHEIIESDKTSAGGMITPYDPYHEQWF